MFTDKFKKLFLGKNILTSSINKGNDITFYLSLFFIIFRGEKRYEVYFYLNLRYKIILNY